MLQVFGANAGKEEAIEAAQSIEKNWMGLGPKVTAFEERFAKRLGKPFVMVNNGSNALHLAVKLLNLPMGSKIVVPSFTWVACVHAIILEGHTPVFCDVDPDCGNVTYETVRAAMDTDVRAIMVVHYAGKPVDGRIYEFGVPVIEDAAHAVDSKVGDKYCGTLGTVGIFSFDPVKNLATPDAGGVCASEEKVQWAKWLRHCGIASTGYEKASISSQRWWEHDIRDVFPKYLPNDVAASVGLVQLDKLEGNQRIRKSLWEQYQKRLRLDNIINPPEAGEGEQHSYFTYLVRVTKGRDQLAFHLKSNQVYTTLRFQPLHKASVFKRYQTGELPGSEVLDREGLNLPLHPRMTVDDVELVVKTIELAHI